MEIVNDQREDSNGTENAETICVSLTSLHEGVTLEVMLRFNRLKALCTDEAAVASALRKSTSGLIEVNDSHYLSLDYVTYTLSRIML